MRRLLRVFATLSVLSLCSLVMFVVHVSNYLSTNECRPIFALFCKRTHLLSNLQFQHTTLNHGGALGEKDREEMRALVKLAIWPIGRDVTYEEKTQLPREKKPNIAQLRGKLTTLLNISRELQDANRMINRPRVNPNLKIPGNYRLSTKNISRIITRPKVENENADSRSHAHVDLQTVSRSHGIRTRVKNRIEEKRDTINSINLHPLPSNNIRPHIASQLKDLQEQQYIAQVKPIKTVNFGQTELIYASEQSDDEAPLVLHLGNNPDTNVVDYGKIGASNKTCQPKNNICFLKTHKCSSSTIQNVLYRWGDDHDLTFVLPKKHAGPYLGNPALFNRAFALPSVNGKYNILANHARYSDKGMAEVMPIDSIYVTVLRDPAKQYESIYDYYRLRDRYGADILRFIKNPHKYFSFEPMGKGNRISGRNPILFDLGLDARHLESDDPAIDEWIHKIDNDFHLVLIAEYFEESMVLLKNELCWALSDMVSFKQNARSQSSVKPITADNADRIRKWNGGDSKLYDYFNKTLWRQIQVYGMDKMKTEVDELRRLNKELSRTCIGSTREFGDPRMWYPSGVRVKSFVLNPKARGNRLCSQLTRPELPYINILRQKQNVMN